jgi:hypothetical protein
MTRGLAAVLVSSVVACGGMANTASPAGDGGADANEAASPDGDAFPCGNALCDWSQICLYPAYGCVALTTDAGTCPAGWEYADASGACLQSPPTPSCVTPASGEGSFDCSAGDAGLDCSVVNAPIPSGCSRVCRAICA